MFASDATGLFRPGLLEGRGVLVAGRFSMDSPTLGETVRDLCGELGAQVGVCEPDATEETVLDATVESNALAAGGLDVLVVDGTSLFAQGQAETGGAAGAAGHAALRACLDTAWNVTRAVINHAFLPGERGGRIVYLAPPPDAGEFAESARAGLENLSRTLSIEWARHGVNVVCIAAGVSTTAGEVASICAYLASPAGAYLSGCQLDLRGV